MAWQLMDSGHAELLRNAIVRVKERNRSCDWRVRLQSFDRKRGVSALSAVQRVIRTERPIAEKCRVSHLENKKMLTILEEVMPLRAMSKSLFFSSIVIVVRTPMDILSMPSS